MDIEGFLNNLKDIKESCDTILVNVNDQYLYGVRNVANAIEDAVRKYGDKRHWPENSIKW